MIQLSKEAVPELPYKQFQLSTPSQRSKCYVKPSWKT